MKTDVVDEMEKQPSPHIQVPPGAWSLLSVLNIVLGIMLLTSLVVRLSKTISQLMPCSQVLILVWRHDPSPLLSLDNTTYQHQKTPQDSSSCVQRTLLNLSVRQGQGGGERQVW